MFKNRIGKWMYIKKKNWVPIVSSEKELEYFLACVYFFLSFFLAEITHPHCKFNDSMFVIKTRVIIFFL